MGTENNQLGEDNISRTVLHEEGCGKHSSDCKRGKEITRELQVPEITEYIKQTQKEFIDRMRSD
jgi:hypothetical protein